MINKFFEDKFPFAYNYFSILLDETEKSKRNFPQALIFEGNDVQSQYLFALELARNLNCKNSKDENCSCVDCKWIKSYTHPAVHIVSQIHNKPEGDESKTVISVKQAKNIENSLALSSDYHRFYIFFSSREMNYDPFELNNFQKIGYSTDIDYSIEPLNFSSFHPKAPNALLKSIEEPPGNTTFVFLTNSKENLLSTIVSRCFSFKLSSNISKRGYSDILNIVKDYPNYDYTKGMYIADCLLDLVKEGHTLEEILTEFIEFLKDLLLKNIDNNLLYAKIQNDIIKISQSIKYSKAKIQDKIVLEGLMLELSKDKI